MCITCTFLRLVLLKNTDVINFFCHFQEIQCLLMILQQKQLKLKMWEKMFFFFIGNNESQYHCNVNRQGNASSLIIITCMAADRARQKARSGKETKISRRVYSSGRYTWCMMLHIWDGRLVLRVFCRKDQNMLSVTSITRRSQGSVGYHKRNQSA